MAKLIDKNGAEMAAALVALSAPVKNFIEDEEFMRAVKECTDKGVRNKLEGFLTIYSDLTPLLLGDKHIRDTLSIVATVEGTTVNKMLKMDGVEMLADCLRAWKEQIQPFFTRLGLSV